MTTATTPARKNILLATLTFSARNDECVDRAHRGLVGHVALAAWLRQAGCKTRVTSFGGAGPQTSTLWIYEVA